MKYQLFKNFTFIFIHVYVFLKLKALPSMLYSLLNQNIIDEDLYLKHKSKFGQHLGNMIKKQKQIKRSFPVNLKFLKRLYLMFYRKKYIIWRKWIPIWKTEHYWSYFWTLFLKHIPQTCDHSVLVEEGFHAELVPVWPQLISTHTFPIHLRTVVGPGQACTKQLIQWSQSLLSLPNFYLTIGRFKACKLPSQHLFQL